MSSEVAIEQAAIRAFIFQKEQEAVTARSQAEVAEASLLQKDSEVAAARQREEAMRTTIENMKVRQFSPPLSVFMKHI